MRRASHSGNYLRTVAPEAEGITPHTVLRLLRLEDRRINKNFEKHIKFIIQRADNGKPNRSNAT